MLSGVGTFEVYVSAGAFITATAVLATSVVVAPRRSVSAPERIPLLVTGGGAASAPAAVLSLPPSSRSPAESDGRSTQDLLGTDKQHVFR